MRNFFLSLGILVTFGLLCPSSFGGSETRYGTGTGSAGRVPTFTLDQAILTALQQNPTLLNAEQEIKRTKGVIIQVRAQALPQVNARAEFEWIDPHLSGARIFGTNTSTGTTTGGGTTPGTSTGAASVVDSPRSQVADPSPTPGVTATELSDVSYNISVLGRQLIFNGTTFNQIRGTFFQRDSAYFAFRNILDQLIATVKTQFYQIVVNRELITVNDQSVHLLESQLKDQQNRFEAGTVPRFNVLQAEVALSNQIPLLITAQNNYRISQLQLAKTLGLDFDPRRGDQAPLEAVGELLYVPREMPITQAIAVAKENRPFIKQQKAVVLSNNSQVGVARSGYYPQINATASTEFLSSPLTDNVRAARSGYIFGATGTWAIWDWGATFGQVKQAQAILEESKATLDDDVRQVELEVQQAFANLLQGKELIQSQEKNVEQATE